MVLLQQQLYENSMRTEKLMIMEIYTKNIKNAIKCQPQKKKQLQKS